MKQENTLGATYQSDAVNNIVSLDAVKNAHSGDTVTGYVYVKTNKDFDFTKPYSTSKREAVFYTLEDKTTQVSAKIWTRNDELIAIRDCVAYITGTVSEYNGEKEISLSNIMSAGDVIPVSYFKQSADVQDVWNRFKTCVGWGTESKDALIKRKDYVVISTLFERNPGLWNRFTQEAAANAMHDAQIGGLINHSVKCVEILCALLNTNPVLNAHRDLLILATFLHDIGKTKELNGGEYTEESYLSHLYYGIEIIETVRDVIEKLYGEHFYHCLVSVIMTHHDRFAMPCNTVWAGIVAKVDHLESFSTRTAEALRMKSYTVNANGSYCIKDNDAYLYF